MGYIDIVNLVTGIFTAILGLLAAYLIIFMIVGLFRKKTFPQAEKKLKYGVVVAARNEEKVIAGLIHSVRQSNYPQENLDVYVIAHNCTDQTAQVARENGAIVYEYNNSAEKTKGYALKYLFDCIKNDETIESHDGYIIMDADNMVTAEFFNKMNDAFIANGCKNVITSYRNARNFGENAMAANYGLMFAMCCSLEARGKTVCNCTAKLLGSGFLVSAEDLKDGWNTVTILDDTDYTIEQALKGKKVIYCDEAEYLDEQPTTFKTMFTQRLRWAKGSLIVCKDRFKQLIKGIFGRRKRKKQQEGQENISPEKPLRLSCYDLLFLNLPIPAVSFFVMILQAVLTAFAPLFGYNAVEVWCNWGLINLITVGRGYLGSIALAILIYVINRKRIKNVPVRVRIASCLTYGLFLYFLVFLQIIAMFKKDLGWSQIVHTSTMDTAPVSQQATNELAEPNTESAE